MRKGLAFSFPISEFCFLEFGCYICMYIYIFHIPILYIRSNLYIYIYIPYSPYYIQSETLDARLGPQRIQRE